MKDEIFIKCQCNTDIVYGTKDEYDEFVYLSIFTLGYKQKPSIWERLKYCYYHLKTGKRFEDQIILNNESAKELGNWLNS